jgi:uncharacterized SAM-binding protein YcdF (DUF218 family)
LIEAFDEVVERQARIIWDYHHLNHALEKCDLILALGSNDLRVAERAADLYVQGWAPLVLMSGNAGALTRERFQKPEAELFAEIAVKKGVPVEAVLIEAASTNTGENIQFSRRLLLDKGLDPARILLVQKPYMERRSYATFMKVWPGKRLIVASPQISFSDYFTPELPRDLVINIMVGDLQRIRIYPSKGFQIEQEIPEEVWQAYEELVALGYDRHLAK